MLCARSASGQLFKKFNLFVAKIIIQDIKNCKIVQWIS